jgi:2'-5' RNA ligase
MNNHFIALRLSQSTTERLSAIIARLQEWELPANWVNPHDFHLTVAFLGALDGQEAQHLPSAIELLAGGFRAPELYFTGLGARAGRFEPRSIFAAISDPTHGCRDMHDDFSDAFALTDTHAFAPHVTLARPLPTSRQRQVGQSATPRTWESLFMAFAQAEWGTCVCDELALFSRSEHGTTRYQVLASWSLS